MILTSDVIKNSPVYHFMLIFGKIQPSFQFIHIGRYILYLSYFFHFFALSFGIPSEHVNARMVLRPVSGIQADTSLFHGNINDKYLHHSYGFQFLLISYKIILGIIILNNIYSDIF